MYIWTQNNTVTGNAVSDNIVGLLISGSNATLSKNYISDNMRGVFMGFNTLGNPKRHNSIPKRVLKTIKFNLVVANAKRINMSNRRTIGITENREITGAIIMAQTQIMTE